MEIHAHVPKIGQTLGHWLLEGSFIVISVALGFWVTQVREERQSHELAARVLKSLRRHEALQLLVPMLHDDERGHRGARVGSGRFDHQEALPVGRHVVRAE